MPPLPSSAPARGRLTMERQGHAVWNAEDAQALFALFPDGLPQYAVVFIDLEGRIVGWSEGAYALTGFSGEEVIGQSLRILFTPEDVALGLHQHELDSARLLGAAEDERWHTRKDGSRLWASGITMPLGPAGQPRGYAKLFRDATHLRQRVDALQAEVAQLRRARQGQDLLLATIVHELRNPLQPLATAADLLSQPIAPELRERATRILRRQLQQMERLVEDLVDMTRVTHGSMRMAFAPVPLQPLLDECLDACREAAARKQIELLRVLPPVPVTVELDPGRFAQVVGNLLGNALKFTPEGGQVALSATVESAHCMVKVKDTGRGIGPELQPWIFSAFTQADGSDTGRGKGLGIGLALVQEIVARHGGSVEVKSEGQDQGSEFTVRIPLTQPHAPL